MLKSCIPSKHLALHKTTTAGSSGFLHSYKFVTAKRDHAKYCRFSCISVYLYGNEKHTEVVRHDLHAFYTNALDAHENWTLGEQYMWLRNVALVDTFVWCTPREWADHLGTGNVAWLSGRALEIFARRHMLNVIYISEDIVGNGDTTPTWTYDRLPYRFCDELIDDRVSNL